MQSMPLFAPCERATPERLLQQFERLSREELVRKFVDSIFDMVVVLNAERQIVLANRAVEEFLGLADLSTVVGERPGDALHCAYANQSQGGCGTTDFCANCGAAKAILAGQRGEISTQECRIPRMDGADSIDLRVCASPLMLESEQYVILSMRDVSHEKRRRALERVFFHDILNTAGSLRGFVELFQDADPRSGTEFGRRLKSISHNLIEQIKSQRDLLAAENGELEVQLTRVNSTGVLKQVVETNLTRIVAPGVQIVIDPNSREVCFQSDEILLHRTLGNMLTNALEAAASNETITLGCGVEGDRIEFWVHNERFIPRNIQLQIFQRSFSTKAVNRGLGTYSMKLLAERYLGGKVSCSTSLEHGTVFKVQIPIH